MPTDTAIPPPNAVQIAMTTLDRTGFFKTADKRPTMVDNLRAAFSRAQLSTQEIRTLRGVISSIDRAHLRQGRLAKKPE